MRARPIFDIILEHGEGPVWCPVERMFYCVDLMKGHCYKVDYSTGKSEQFDLGQPLGVMALREKEGMVVGVRDGFGLFDPATLELYLINDSPEKDNDKTRMNDGAVDPAGRFLAGTMTYDGREPIGNLYALQQDQSYELLEENLFLSNGMGWSPDFSTFYLIDTIAQVMYSYEYDILDGKISNRGVKIQWAKDEFPDGLAVDSEGGFWVAMWGGGKISHFDHKGEKIEDIAVPVDHPTSCCFGGEDMKTLLVTTSCRDLSPEERKLNPLAGRVFKLETKVKGQIQKRYKG